MWFTHLAGLLQSYGRPDFNPATIASEINRHLCYLQPVAPFVTALIAQMDCDRVCSPIAMRVTFRPFSFATTETFNYWKREALC